MKLKKSQKINRDMGKLIRCPESEKNFTGKKEVMYTEYDHPNALGNKIRAFTVSGTKFIPIFVS